LGFKEARKQEVLKEIPPKRTNKIPQQQKTISKFQPSEGILVRNSIHNNEL
jgi:hypothetical protein